MPRRSKRLQGIAAPPVQPDALPRRRRSRLQAAREPLAVIDYSAFPHIIEAIVMYSSDTVLRVFRQTCRSLQRFVDDWFPRSIIFDTDGIARWPGRNDASLDLVRLVDMHISRDMNDFGEEDVEEAVELNQVCSCEGDVWHLRLDFERMWPFLENVKMVRQDHTTCPTSIPSTMECTTFFDLTSAATDEAVILPREWITAISDKHVLHFLYSPNKAFPPSLTEDDFWRFPVHSIVIIFSAIETDLAGEAQPSCTGDYRCGLYRGLLSLISDIVGYASGAFLEDNFFGPFVTFVGVETWDKTCIDSGIVLQHRRHRNETMVGLIKDMIVDILLEWDTVRLASRFENVEDAREHLEVDCNVLFQTLEEYRDEVGDEQFALEMGKGWQGRNAWTESQV